MERAQEQRVRVPVDGLQCPKCGERFGLSIDARHAREMAATLAGFPLTALGHLHATLEARNQG